MEEGGDEVETALHSSREILHAIMTTIGQAHRIETLVDPIAQEGALEAEQLAEDLKLFLGGEFVVEGDILRDQIQVVSGVRVLIVGQLAVDGDGASIGGFQSRNQRHKGGFSGVVGAEEAEKFTGGDIERDPVEGVKWTVGFGNRVDR